MNIKQKSDRFRSIVNEMADLYEKKNSNYGDSFGQLYSELGPTSGLVPLWNKLHRATSLIKGSKNNFESLEDTFKDLACYAIMNLIEMEAEESKKANYGTSLTELTPKDIDLARRESISTIDGSIDPCEDCPVKKMLQPGDIYIGDLPCQWCSKNPLRFQCLNGTITTNGSGTTSTHTLNNSKGEINNE